MPGRSLERIRLEALRRRVAELEEELRRVRGQLAAVREWLEDLETQHALLSVKVYDLKLRLREGENG